MRQEAQALDERERRVSLKIDKLASGDKPRLDQKQLATLEASFKQNTTSMAQLKVVSVDEDEFEREE